MKIVPLKWNAYFTNTCISLFFLLSPIALSFFFSFDNPNNSDYTAEILVKHFAKLSISIFFLAGLIGSPFLFLNHLQSKIYVGILVIILFIPAIIDFIHVLLFKSRAASSSYYSLFATSRNEAIEFAMDYSTINLVLGILIILAIPFLIYYVYTFKIPLKLKKIIFGIYLCSYCAVVILVI